MGSIDTSTDQTEENEFKCFKLGPEVRKNCSLKLKVHPGC